MQLETQAEHIKVQSQGHSNMASSQAKEVESCSSTDQQEGTTTEPPVLTHKVPIPHKLDKSKLDWILQISEQFFEALLRTVVSSIHLLLYFSQNLIPPFT